MMSEENRWAGVPLAYSLSKYVFTQKGQLKKIS